MTNDNWQIINPPLPPQPPMPMWQRATNVAGKMKNAFPKWLLKCPIVNKQPIYLLVRELTDRLAVSLRRGPAIPD